MIFEKKRVFILVKTYPTISTSYSELVCTAGVLEDGSWIRLYPVPFRKLDIEQKFPKYTWIQVEVSRNTSDFRPESYRPDLSSIVVEERPKKANWDERRKIIFKKQKLYTNLSELIGKAKNDRTSLAVFKPTKLLDFRVEEVERDWDPKKLAALKASSRQLNLFQTLEEIEYEFKVVPKVPYKFSYTFEDDAGRQSTLMITDWEIGMLFFNCLERANGDEKVATEIVKQKYFDSFTTHDLHFFLGTMKGYHNVSQNPFIIVGVYYPPPFEQLSFF